MRAVPVRVWRVASSSCLAYEERFSLQTILDTQETAFLIDGARVSVIVRVLTPSPHRSSGFAHQLNQ